MIADLMLAVLATACTVLLALALIWGVLWLIRWDKERGRW